MNVDTLLLRLQKSFQRCASVPEYSGIYRCERLFRNKPRSVFFFKAGTGLPDSDELSRIHRDVVAPSYFMAKGALRWNHYLVFVADDKSLSNPEFDSLRRMVEANKDYARKLVVLDSQLADFIDSSITFIYTDRSNSSVSSIWAQKLASAGLSQIQEDVPRAALIRQIRAGEIRPSNPGEGPCLYQPKSSQALTMIEKFTLNKFGTRTITGSYEFGRVNLIRGPNGCGKTSLLEAIEYFFCGATFRSDCQEAFDAEAIFAGPPQHSVKFELRNNAYYQDCDQRWYGRTVNRRNRLSEGFARFNFLNTDAAVHFVNDTNIGSLNDALSKIALGPDASYTWNRIGEFVEDLEKDLASLNASITVLIDSINQAKQLEVVATSVSPQIEASLNNVHELLARLGWTLPSTVSTPPDVAWFAQFQSLSEFVSAFHNFDSKRTIIDLDRTADAINKQLQQLQLLQQKSELEKGNQVCLQSQRLYMERQLTLVQRLGRYLDTGLDRLLIDENRISLERINISRQLISLEELDVLEEVAKHLDCLSLSSEAFEARAVEQLAVYRNRIQELERERTAISKRLALVDQIVSEIRSLGYKYAEQAPHAEECPLCRTHMCMEELTRKIQEVGGQSSRSTQLETVSIEISSIQPLISALDATTLTIKRAKLYPNVEAGIQKCRKQHDDIQTLSAALVQAISRRQSLENQGFEASELSELRAQFESVKEWKHLSSQNPIQVKDLYERLQAELSSLKAQELQLHGVMVETKKDLQCLLENSGVINEVELREKLLTASQAVTTLKKAFSILPLEVQMLFVEDLPTLAKRCNQTLEAIVELSYQVKVELGRNKELEIIRRRLDCEQEKLSVAEDEQRRLQAALGVLIDIKQNYSLESGVESFLSSNIASIQRVFSKIHVPRELLISSLDERILKRTGKRNGESANFNQISTGQRAALVLSVFLTLNLSLREAPPQVLIDDPIAHIDDLNSLSFLDYLADIAESGIRQIFFATADEKLANLFQKKMEFLGNDFRTIDLSPRYS